MAERPIKIVEGNACGAKVNLKKLQEAGKSTQASGPPTRGKVRKDR